VPIDSKRRESLYAVNGTGLVGGDMKRIEIYRPAIERKWADGRISIFGGEGEGDCYTRAEMTIIPEEDRRDYIDDRAGYVKLSDMIELFFNADGYSSIKKKEWLDGCPILVML
jgi:hypothetical protein